MGPMGRMGPMGINEREAALLERVAWLMTVLENRGWRGAAGDPLGNHRGSARRSRSMTRIVNRVGFIRQFP
jgi:hypothetical protein